MAVRTDITVDWASSPRLITVLAPSTEVTIQDLVDTCRALEDDLQNLTYGSIISAAGKEQLGGGVTVGITATLLNAVLAFQARTGPSYTQCSVSGGNLVAVDSLDAIISAISPTSFTQVLLTASSSATLQELGAIQYSSFNGGVTVDVTSTHSGTIFPVGTQEQPVNNMVDALAIAVYRGFKKFYIVGNITVDNITVDDYIFIGEGQTQSTITLNPAASTIGCQFLDAHVAGTLDGSAYIRDCVITDLNYVDGFVVNCLLEAGTITLGGASEAHFLSCWSSHKQGILPTIDMGGSGMDLVVRGHSGAIRLTNKTGPDRASFDFLSGEITVEASVTSGPVVMRGVGTVVNNSANVQVDTSRLVSSTKVVETEGNITDNEALSIILSAVAGTYDAATGTFKTPNGNAIRLVSNSDSNGNRFSVVTTPSA